MLKHIMLDEIAGSEKMSTGFSSKCNIMRGDLGASICQQKKTLFLCLGAAEGLVEHDVCLCVCVCVRVSICIYMPCPKPTRFFFI